MSLPQLTHLQFLVLSHLAAGESSGREMRAYLRENGVRQSGPAFYQFIAGMEDAGYVEGWYEQQVVDGQIIRERHYRPLASGRRALQRSRDFYAAALGIRPKLLRA